MARRSIHSLSNETLARLLEEIADHLARDGTESFRVAAYRNAALSIRRSPRELAELFESEGQRGLERLPGIGRSLAKKLADALRHGKSRLLERLRRRQAGAQLLTTLPTVGPRLAERIRRDLGDDSLEAVLRAARDGRLRRVAGFGRKRVEAIRQSLAERLGDDTPSPPTTRSSSEPSVADLLEIDREYRQAAREGRLMTVRPRKFNPTAAAWLPILHTERGGRRFRAQFANTARSHATGHAHDWVVILCVDKEAFGQWTVVTATHGPLRGQRVVRGRERECQSHYQQTGWIQLSLPGAGSSS
jgi:Holliday junction resolvasome RuvABC DNA-binding subunit